jgi:hypothetical protein
MYDYVYIYMYDCGAMFVHDWSTCDVKQPFRNGAWLRGFKDFKKLEPWEKLFPFDRRSEERPTKKHTKSSVGKENQEYLRVFFWMWFNWIHLGGATSLDGLVILDWIFVENGRMAPQTTLVSNRTMSQWSHSLRVYRWLWDNYGLWFMDVFAGFKYIYMVNGVYKLSYNWGASPCMASNLPYFIDLCDIWGTKILNWKVIIRLGMALRNQLNRSFIYIHLPNLWPLFNLRSKFLGWQVFILYLPFGYGSVGPRNSMIMMIEFIGILK